MGLLEMLMNPVDRKWRRLGQAVVESTIVLPILIAMVVAVIAAALHGMRICIGQLAASEAARVGSMYEMRYMDDEASRVAPKYLFSSISTNSIADSVKLKLMPRPIINSSIEVGAHPIEGVAGIVSVLPPDLSDDILRTGDAPSPYCRSGGSYIRCGYE